MKSEIAKTTCEKCD